MPENRSHSSGAGASLLRSKSSSITPFVANAMQAMMRPCARAAGGAYTPGRKRHKHRKRVENRQIDAKAFLASEISSLHRRGCA